MSAADMEIDMEIERNVSAKLCDGGHVCTFPKECCSLGCCSYSTFPQIGNSVTEMFKFLFWYYWYLWIAVLAGLIVAAACGCWLCRKRHASMMDDGTISDRASTGSCYLPPHYSRCSSIVQAMPPPYNEVTAKPDLYPLVIGYDDGFGKGASGLVMRYFRSLSHASTLDSLSSSFMCNVVNEANTIIPPPYSCNNSVDELSSAAGAAAMGAIGGARERPTNFGEGSLASLANHRTTSDVSSLAAQSPLSPPRATSPTIELRELLDKIQQLPQLPAAQQNRPQALFSLGLCSTQQRSSSPPGDDDLQQQQSSCSSGSGSGVVATSNSGARTKRTRGKTYVAVGPPPPRAKSGRSWLSRSAPTTPSGAGGVPGFLSGHHYHNHHHHHLHHHHHHSRGSGDSSEAGNRQQAVPLLLAEQDESENGAAPEVV